MKKLKKLTVLLTFYFLLLTFNSSAQNVGINTTGATPDSSALLDIDAAPGNNKGLLIPRVSLTDTADVTTITGTQATSLMLYNTNVTMAGGNGAGYYYWSGTKWLAIPAPTNGAGTSGQVLSSTGSGSGTQWATLSSSGGGATGCATCISQTAVGTTGNWATCRNSCVAMGAGWRMPTWDEETYIASGALGTPTGGWQAGYVWTSTPWDARVVGTLGTGNWVILYESTGDWGSNNYPNALNCRCVR